MKRKISNQIWFFFFFSSLLLYYVSRDTKLSFKNRHRCSITCDHFVIKIRLILNYDQKRSFHSFSFHRRKGSCRKRDFRWRAISLFFLFFFDSRSSRSSSRIIDPPLQLEFLTVSAEDLLKTTTAIAVSVLLPRVAKRTVIFRLLNELLSPLSKHTASFFSPPPSHGVLSGMYLVWRDGRVYCRYTTSCWFTSFR